VRNLDRVALGFHSKDRLYIAIGGNIAREMGLEALGRVAILWGLGNDEGKIRIVPVDAGGVALLEPPGSAAGALRTHFSVLPERYRGARAPSRARPFRFIEDKGRKTIEVELPETFSDKPLRTRKAPRAAREPHPKNISPEAPPEPAPIPEGAPLEPLYDDVPPALLRREARGGYTRSVVILVAIADMSLAVAPSSCGRQNNWKAGVG
jgi:hypothetical protein